MPNTASTSDLTSLLARVEAATGPDRELDAAICATLRYAGKEIPDWAHRNFPTWRGRPDGRVEVVHEGGRGGMHWAIPSMTASIDAALALVQQVLPGAEYATSTIHGLAFAELPINSAWPDGIQSANRKDGNMPLAIVEATLRALIAQSKEQAHGE